MNLKEKIVYETLKLFSLKGFLSTSIGDILAAADTSKGGLYNHFKSKEDLFLEVLREARRIWREKNLAGLELVPSPLGKVIRLLQNYRDRYLKDSEDFPGGCVFVALSVELDDQRPRLSNEITKGFHGLKNMIRGFLDQAKEKAEIRRDVDTAAVAEMIFAGVLGASVVYGSEKSTLILDQTIDSLIDYVEGLRPG